MSISQETTSGSPHQYRMAYLMNHFASSTRDFVRQYRNALENTVWPPEDGKGLPKPWVLGESLLPMRRYGQDPNIHSATLIEEVKHPHFLEYSSPPFEFRAVKDGFCCGFVVQADGDIRASEPHHDTNHQHDRTYYSKRINPSSEKAQTHDSGTSQSPPGHSPALSRLRPAAPWGSPSPDLPPSPVPENLSRFRPLTRNTHTTPKTHGRLARQRHGLHD